MNAIVALASAAYLSMYPALLLLPLIYLCYDRSIVNKGRAKQPGELNFALGHLGTFLVAIFGLLGASFLVTGFSWDFIPATYGFHLLVPDLAPNVGLWWYFFIEIFDSFREFFLGVFWLHLVGYVGGLTLRLRRQPLFVITSLIGIFAIFKPYPSIADVSLYFALLPLYRHLSPRKYLASLMKEVETDCESLVTRYTFFAAAALLYATLLGPAFYHLWIYAGSGNANFFYAITLVWSLGLTILVADLIFAALRDEWEQDHPEMKGKEVRQI